MARSRNETLRLAVDRTATAKISEEIDNFEMRLGLYLPSRDEDNNTTTLAEKMRSKLDAYGDEHETPPIELRAAFEVADSIVPLDSSEVMRRLQSKNINCHDAIRSMRKSARGARTDSKGGNVRKHSKDGGEDLCPSNAGSRRWSAADEAPSERVRTFRTTIESCFLKPSTTSRGSPGTNTVRHGRPFITATQSSGRRDFDDYRKQFAAARGTSARSRKDEEKYLYNNYLGCIDPLQRSIFDMERKEYFQRSIEKQRETFSRQRARSASKQRIGRENMSSLVHQRTFAQERQRRVFERIVRTHHRHPHASRAQPGKASLDDRLTKGDMQSLRELDNFSLDNCLYQVVRPSSAY